MNNVRWKKLLIVATTWLLTEMFLNFVGLDDLADYSEFIFERRNVVQVLSIATFL